MDRLNTLKVPQTLLTVCLMPSPLTSLVHTCLGAMSFFPSRCTPSQELREFMQRLHPIVSPRPLLRCGPPGDGGYLVPDDWQGITACFSPGVSTESGFERECADRGLRVFLADGSVSGPATTHPKFSFSRMYVGAVTNATYMTMDEWVEAADCGDGDLLLQMDIEGAEYETLLAMSMGLQTRFRIIVVEFHNLHWLFSHPYFLLASRVFDKLLTTHSSVHIHPNNVRPPVCVRGLSIPPLMEFTFLRNDRIGPRRFASQFPHLLDAANTTGEPHSLPRCWYADGTSALASCNRLS